MTKVQDNTEAFLIILKDFAEVLEDRLKRDPEYPDKIMADIENSPHDWFKAWCEELSMGANLMIFATATNLLLTEYTSECLRRNLAKRLIPGHEQLQPQAPAPDGG